MPTERPEAVAAAVVAAGLAAAILVLAGPRLAAAVAALPGTPVLDDLRAGRPVDTAALHRLAGSRAAALGRHESGAAWSDLALARQVLAGRAGRAVAGPRRAAAAAALRRSLALAPANPFAWYRLARLDAARRAPAGRVAAAIAASIVTGPRVPGLVTARRALLRRLAVAGAGAVGPGRARLRPAPAR